MSDGISSILTIAMAITLLICVSVIIRRLWRAITNPQIAYRMGRGTRKSIEGAANAAGRATGTVESLSRVVARSFDEGRSTTNGSRSNRDGT